MSAQSRLSSLISAVGADVKALQNSVNSAPISDPPFMFHMEQSVAQSIPHASWTAINQLYSFGQSSGRGYAQANGGQFLQMNRSGIWLLEGGVTFASAANNYRYARLHLYTGGIIPGSRVSNGAGDISLQPSIIAVIAATDYLYLEVYQSSGAAINTIASTGETQTTLKATYLGPAS